jgi:amidase
MRPLPPTIQEQTMFETTQALVDALQQGKLSATELLAQTIARIERVDAELNAVVVRDFDRAREQAAAADAALQRGERRPLLGIPMTVKEAVHVAGLPTTWGIPGTERLPVRDDAVAVQRLKAAGAVIVGKTNVPLQLADWQSYNAIYGTTRNPWDLERTPGGSSGGAAAALASGCVSLELGTDIGGSLRVPAHFCGVFAHKPTHGLVPMRGVAPPGAPVLPTGPQVDLAVVGPMARSAEDLMLALDVLAGPDEVPATAYRLALPAPRHERLKDFRVLVLDAHPLQPTSSEVRDTLQRFTAQLAASGCRVAKSSTLLPDLTRVATLYTQLLMSFMGADMPDEAYRGLQSTASRLAPNDTGPEALQQRSLVLSHRDWIRADRQRAAIASEWRKLFREFDAVVTPVSATTAFAHDHAPMEQRHLRVDGVDMPYAQQALWISLASLTGLPATAMPIGLGASGLPVGVQVIGPHLEDRTPLAFARLAEREFGGFVAPPRYVD